MYINIIFFDYVLQISTRSLLPSIWPLEHQLCPPLKWGRPPYLKLLDNEWIQILVPKECAEININFIFLKFCTLILYYWISITSSKYQLDFSNINKLFMKKKKKKKTCSSLQNLRVWTLESRYTGGRKVWYELGRTNGCSKE